MMLIKELSNTAGNHCFLVKKTFGRKSHQQNTLTLPWEAMRVPRYVNFLLSTLITTWIYKQEWNETYCDNVLVNLRGANGKNRQNKKVYYINFQKHWTSQWCCD